MAAKAKDILQMDLYALLGTDSTANAKQVSAGWVVLLKANHSLLMAPFDGQILN